MPTQRAQSALPRIRDLNPRVTVKSDGSLTDLLSKDQTYYTPFDVVIACDHDFMTLSMINTAARFASRPFYAAGIHGFYGYIFADLVGHEFVVERERSNVATKVGVETMTRSVLGVTTKKKEGTDGGRNVEMVKKQEIYCPLILANSSPLPLDVLSNRRKLKSVPALLPCLRALFDFQRTYAHLPGHNSQDLAAFTALATTKSRELQLPPETLRAEFLRSFIQNIGAEIAPTAAFVGGRVSEDVINVLGKREQPVQNFALFDGENLEGRIYSLYSPPPELAMGMDGMNGMEQTAAGGMDDMGMGDPSMMGIGGVPMNDGDIMAGMGMADGAMGGMPETQQGMQVIGDGMQQDATMSGNPDAGPATGTEESATSGPLDGGEAGTGQ